MLTRRGAKASRWLRMTRLPAAAGYTAAAGIAGIAVTLRILLDPVWGTRQPFIFFFGAIMVSAWIGGFGPGLVTTLLSALAADWFWLHPTGSLGFRNAPEFWALGVFIVVGAAISALAGAWRRASAEVARSEERFRLALEAAPTAVLLVDSRGAILVANEVALKLFGYPPEDLVGRPVESLVPPRFREAHPGLRQGFFRSSERRLMGAGRDLYALRRDGTEVPVEIGLSPFSVGAEKAVIVAVTDVTERKRSAGLVEATLRARENFLSAASHEMRSPVNALLLQLEVLARKLKGGDAELTRLTDRARAQADRLSGLLRNLLEEARIASGALVLHRQEIDFREVVRLALDRLEDEHREFDAVVQVPADPVIGQWDRMRLERIVENLLSNAVKYGAGKPITVTLGVDGKAAVFSVIDQGPGIDPGQRERLFERFYRADSAGRYEGFGLGLWITRQIVEAMHGSISVESALGEGATFTVVLPLDPATATPTG